MSERRQFCTFRIEGQLFGIAVEDVQEIILDQPTTRIPLAPAAVSGLINLRGQILPIIELRRCLDLPPLANDDGVTNVVLTTEDGPVSLRVDAIGDVLEVDALSFEPPPQNVRGTTRRLIRGVYKLDGELLLVLSTDVVIELAVCSVERATLTNERELAS